MSDQGITPTVPASGLTPTDSTFSAGGGLFVAPLPGENAFVLRHEEFLILCEGEATKDAERWRDSLIGVFISTLMGVVGLGTSVDWSNAFKQVQIAPLVSGFILTAATVISFALWVFFLVRCRRDKQATAYSRLKRKIMNHFDAVGDD